MTSSQFNLTSTSEVFSLTQGLQHVSAFNPYRTPASLLYYLSDGYDKHLWLKHLIKWMEVTYALKNFLLLLTLIKEKRNVMLHWSWCFQFPTPFTKDFPFCYDFFFFFLCLDSNSSIQLIFTSWGCSKCRQVSDTRPDVGLINAR